jgi:hypothetical protein
MIVLFRDSSVNYWLNNSVVDCGNVDVPNSNLEIVFPPEYDENEKKISNIRTSKGYKKKYNNTTKNVHEMIAKHIKENDENEKKIYNIRSSNGYKKKYNNTTNNSIKIAHELDAYIHPSKGYRINTKTNNKKFEPVYYHE